MAYEQKPYNSEEEQDEVMQPLSTGGSEFQQDSGEQKRKPVTEGGSGMFTNIQKYMQSPESGKRMAEKIGDTYTKKASDIQTQADKSLGEFKNQYQPEQKRLERASENAARYIEEAGREYSGDSSLTDFESPEYKAETLRRISEMKGLREGRYIDPTDVDLSSQQFAQENLQRKALGALSEGGTRMGLEEVYKRPDYTSGMKDLDTLVLRQKEAQDVLRGRTQEATGGLEQYDIAGKQEAARQKDIALRDLAQSYRTGGTRDVKQQVRSAEDILAGAVETRRKALDKKRNKEAEYLRGLAGVTEIGRGEQGDAIAAEEYWGGKQQVKGQYGLPTDLRTYGADPTAFFNNPFTESSASEVLSDRDLATSKALAALAGTPEQIAFRSREDARDIFDEAGYMKAIETKKAEIIQAAAVERARRIAAAKAAAAEAARRKLYGGRDVDYNAYKSSDESFGSFADNAADRGLTLSEAESDYKEGMRSADFQGSSTSTDSDGGDEGD